jgi:hypothetical protein
MSCPDFGCLSLVFQQTVDMTNLHPTPRCFLNHIIY